MTYQKIEHHVKNVRNKLKKGKFKEALTGLESFIEYVNDPELDDSFIALSARYSKELEDQLSGIKDNEIEHNKIIRSITALLRTTKEIAIENAAINTGKELENLADIGTQTIERLKQINLLMAKSRILELEVMVTGPTSMLLSEDIKSRVMNDIERLKSIIKEDEFEI